MGEACEEVFDGVGGEGAGEYEALTAVALFLLEMAVLVVLFDALGEGCQTELFPELQEGVEERSGFGRVGDRADERSVDLEDVDGELA